MILVFLSKQNTKSLESVIDQNAKMKPIVVEGLFMLLKRIEETISIFVFAAHIQAV